MFTWSIHGSPFINHHLLSVMLPCCSMWPLLMIQVWSIFMLLCVFTPWPRLLSLAGSRLHCIGCCRGSQKAWADKGGEACAQLYDGHTAHQTGKHTYTQASINGHVGTALYLENHIHMPVFFLRRSFLIFHALEGLRNSSLYQICRQHHGWH